MDFKISKEDLAIIREADVTGNTMNTTVKRVEAAIEAYCEKCFYGTYPFADHQEYLDFVMECIEEHNLHNSPLLKGNMKPATASVEKITIECMAERYGNRVKDFYEEEEYEDLRQDYMSK